MLSRSDIVWFTDPNPSDSAGAPTRILINQMRSVRRNMLGQLYPLDPATYVMDAGQGWFTVDGVYVNGVVDKVVTPGAMCLWLASDEADSDWGIGMVGNRIIVDGVNHRVINSPVRASGRRLMEADKQVVPDSLIFKAASWALSLMPAPDDTAAMVEKKTAIAKARWINLYSRWKLSVEGTHRNWTEYLDGIKDEAHFGNLRYKAQAIGSVTIPQGQSPLIGLSEATRNALAKLPTPPTRANISISVPFPFVIDQRFSSREEAIGVRNITDHLQQKLQDWSVGYSLDRIDPIPVSITEHQALSDTLSL